MLRVGLTGGIGSGKSMVAGMFQQLGITIIDADIIAYQLVAPGTPLLEQIIQSFGAEYLREDGSLDRKSLAECVFSQPEQKQILEALIHPQVREHIQQQLDQRLTEPYVIVVIPLLLETGYHDLIDRILVVDCTPEQQLQRVLQRDQREPAQIERIMRQQVSREQRLVQADDVLNNSTDPADTQTQVEKLHQTYCQLATAKS